MRPTDVTACIVTRGDVDLTPILDSLIFTKVVVWNNSIREKDVGTFGRYCAAEEAETDAVYFQDDDVIVPRTAQRSLLKLYTPGTLLSNMEEERNRFEFSQLVWCGWGSLTERRLYRDAFARWGADDDRWFRLVGCDVVFAMLTPSQRVDLGTRHLEYAFGHDRTYAQRGFVEAKQRYYARALAMV